MVLYRRQKSRLELVAALSIILAFSLLMMAATGSSSDNSAESSLRPLEVVQEASPLLLHRHLKGGKGGGSFGGGGGTKYYGSSSGGSSSRPVTTTYTTPGLVGYRPYYAGASSAQDYNCTDSYNVTTNITTTTCVHYSDGDGISDGAAIGIFVGASVLLVCGACFMIWRSAKKTAAASKDVGFMSTNDRDYNNPRHYNYRWNKRLDQARTEIHGAYDKGYKKSTPQNGSYAYSYRQNGNVLSGKCHLFFSEKEGDGFVISGTTSDPDGLTNIDEGFCTYHGSAFWKETYVSGDTGLQVLNKGEFDFSTHSFKGQWWATSNEEGSFDTFKLEEKDDATVTASTSSA